MAERLRGGGVGAGGGWVGPRGAPPDPASAHLVVTDREGFGDAQAVGVLQMRNPTASQGVAFAHWMVAGGHAIGSYLPSVEPVVASLPAAMETASSGEPVLWGLVRGRRVPVVLAGEAEGRRGG